MLLTELNPLSKPVASTEILILLALSALVGWIIARWITNIKISALQKEILLKEGELTDCSENLQVRQAMGAHTSEKQQAVIKDDLKIIEGIGEKIELILNERGIYTFEHLAKVSFNDLEEILDAAGPRFQIHNPGTWPEQAALAKEGNWEALRSLQERLIGGREP